MRSSAAYRRSQIERGLRDVRDGPAERVAAGGPARVAAASAAGPARRRAAHDFVRRRHASRYFSEVFAATSDGSSGPGAVLSQSSVSR